MMNEWWVGSAVLGLYTRSKSTPLRNLLFGYSILLHNGGLILNTSKAIPAMRICAPSAPTNILFLEPAVASVIEGPSTELQKAPGLSIVSDRLMGFEIGHSFLIGLIDSILENAPFFSDLHMFSEKRAVSALAGSGALTRAARQFSGQLNFAPLPRFGHRGKLLVGVATRNGSLSKGQKAKISQQDYNRVILHSVSTASHTDTKFASGFVASPDVRLTHLNENLKNAFRSRFAGIPREVADKASSLEHRRHFKIPSVLFQTGPSRTMPTAMSSSIERLQSRNTALDYVFMDDRAVKRYMRDQWSHHPIYEVFEKSQLSVMRADIFRYCLLFERGGFYVDISKTVLPPLRSLVGPDSTGLVTFERNAAAFSPSKVCPLMLYPSVTCAMGIRL